MTLTLENFDGFKGAMLLANVVQDGALLKSLVFELYPGKTTIARYVVTGKGQADRTFPISEFEQALNWYNELQE